MGRGKGEGRGGGEGRREGREGGKGGEGRGKEKGWEGRGERRGCEGVHNLRKTTPPRHQMAGYGPEMLHRYLTSPSPREAEILTQKRRVKFCIDNEQVLLTSS